VTFDALALGLVIHPVLVTPETSDSRAWGFDRSVGVAPGPGARPMNLQRMRIFRRLPMATHASRVSRDMVLFMATLAVQVRYRQ
jgi:hypothetical protein